MKIAKDWKDYKVIATGDGEKLESWNGVVLLRPDPQVIWHAKKELNKEKNISDYKDACCNIYQSGRYRLALAFDIKEP